MKFISRLFSHTAISFVDGRCVMLKGKCGHQTLLAIAEVLADAGVKRGEIWIAGNQRVTFSSEIDERLHQRLRNIVFG